MPLSAELLLESLEPEGKGDLRCPPERAQHVLIPDCTTQMRWALLICELEKEMAGQEVPVVWALSWKPAENCAHFGVKCTRTPQCYVASSCPSPQSSKSLSHTPHTSRGRMAAHIPSLLIVPHTFCTPVEICLHPSPPNSRKCRCLFLSPYTGSYPLLPHIPAGCCAFQHPGGQCWGGSGTALYP